MGVRMCSQNVHRTIRNANTYTQNPPDLSYLPIEKNTRFQRSEVLERLVCIVRLPGLDVVVYAKVGELERVKLVGRELSFQSQGLSKLWMNDLLSYRRLG